MSMTLKISYAVESVVHASDAAVEQLLHDYRRVRSKSVDVGSDAHGFVNAASKLPDDATTGQIIRTVIGEVTSLIITEEVPGFYPPADLGLTARISKVAYQETPEKLDPPAGATPLVVHVHDRSVH